MELRCNSGTSVRVNYTETVKTLEATSKRRVLTSNDNNLSARYNNNIEDKVIVRVHSVHSMNVEDHQAAADPQTNPPDFNCDLRCVYLLVQSTDRNQSIIQPEMLTTLLPTVFNQNDLNLSSSI